MKRILAVILTAVMMLSCLAVFTVSSHASSEITIAPFNSGMENYQEATQILICPKIAGNWTDDWGGELMNYTWEISLTKSGESTAKTVRLKPASIYPGNSWGIIRFTPCLAEGENQFIPVKDASYTVSVRVFDGNTLLYTADGGSQTWKLTVDPIVPEVVEPGDEVITGSGWELRNGVLTVTSQSVMGGGSSAASDYPWNDYRTSILEVVVSGSVTSVGKLAFDSCTAMKKITFGENVTTYYNDCIARNAALKTVVFLAPAVSIGQGIVYLTNNIDTVTITGQTFEEFKEIATRYAYNFESYGGIRTGFDKARFIINVPISYSFSGGVLTVTGDRAVGDGESLQADYPWDGIRDQVIKVIVEDGVPSVGAYAFADMSSLQEIRLGTSLTMIGDYAFENDTAFVRFYMKGAVPQIGEGVFRGCAALQKVVITDSTVQEFLEAAEENPYNLAANGGIATGLDSARIDVVYVEGFWKGIDGLTEAGSLMKQYDVNKDGRVSISDVSELLDYLASSIATWVGDFYNVNGIGKTNVNDVTALLNRIAYTCSHEIAFTDACAATCTEDGYDAYYYCDICETFVTAQTVRQAKGHTVINDPAVPATCGSDGLTLGSHCSVCGEVFAVQTVIPATGAHTFVYTDARAATCGRDGYTAGRVCSVCGYVVSGYEIIPATGDHTVVIDAAVDATCLRSGLTEGSHCSVCGNILEEQLIVEAQGHQFANDRCVYCECADTALLSGKTALFTGDSLCAASTYDTEHQWWGWAERIKRAYGLSSYVKTGADGASVSNCRGTNTIIRQIENNKTRTFDYIVLEGSTNDGWDKVAIGAMTAGTAAQANPANFDLTTFAGGLENLFYYAKQYFPNAVIGYVFTHKMNSNTGYLRDMSAYLAMAKQICEKWNIPMLNVDESPDFAVKYFAGISALVPDGIHPSSAGYELLYPAIARFMAEISLDGDYAIYEAKIETLSQGPEPYAPLPDKESDPQGWIRWLQKDMGETTPMLETGSAYGIRYNADGQTHVASPWEYWGGHYQFDYIFSPNDVDFTANIGTANYGYVWEIWYKDADVEEDYRHITTAPWSVYAPSGIYRIDTYDQGMNDLVLPEGATSNAYSIVIIIYDTAGNMVGWKKDTVNFTDSSVLFMQQALDAGAIGNT